MIKCPQCGSGVYKEFLDDGRAKPCCTSKLCGWEGEPLDKHSFIDIPTMPEIKREWR